MEGIKENIDPQQESQKGFEEFWNEQVQKITQATDLELNTFVSEENQQLWSSEEDFKKIKKKYKRHLNELKKAETSKQTFDNTSKFWNDLKSTLINFKTSRHQLDNFLKDTQPLKEEIAGLNKTKEMLEKLFEALQGQYKQSIEEQKTIHAEEKDKRTELTSSFQQTINEIQKEVEEQAQYRIEQSKTNEILKEKIKEVKARYEQREFLFQAELKKKEIEVKIIQTQFQSEMLGIQQQATLLNDCQKGLDSLKENQTKLDERWKFYEEKDKEYNELISMTNNQFGFFKESMDNLSKQTGEVEKKINEQKKKLQQKDDKNFELAKTIAQLRAESHKEDKSTETLNKLLLSLQDQLAQLKSQQ